MSKRAETARSGGTSLGHLLAEKGLAVSRETPAVQPPAAAEPAPPARIAFGGASKIVLRRERKGRGGKVATVIEGMRLPPSALERIARELKRALGCGASIDGATIVVQGDMAPRIEQWLVARGAPRVVVGN